MLKTRSGLYGSVDVSEKSGADAALVQSREDLLDEDAPHSAVGGVSRDDFAGVPPLERIEMELLLEGIYRHYGYDFRSYARSSLRRRLKKRLEAEKLTTFSALQDRVLHNSSAMEGLVRDMSVNVTGMFRDPTFFLAFRQKVVPMLRTYPFVRIWHAGCASGEEVYAMAILLEEEGLYERSRLYATDMNAEALDRARTGIFPISR